MLLPSKIANINSKKKNVVISGISLRSGGTLSIFYDLLEELKKGNYFHDYNIFILVHNKEFFSEYKDVAQLIEYPYAKRSWLLRLFYEYIYFKKQFKKVQIYVWLSLHDISPNIICEKQFVYCHNPTPFLRASYKIFKFSKTVFLFALFYKYLYRINIHRNTAVLVQQEWIRKKFMKMYNLPENKIIVAKPSIKHLPDVQSCIINQAININFNNKFNFIYPAFPRVFKNFEVLCEAVKYLPDEVQRKIQVIITIDGTENKYASYIYKKYHLLSSIKFIGLVDRRTLFNIYNKVNAMIFPSKLETWGLPMTEFMCTQKPILAADLPYAHETLMGYKFVSYFDMDSPCNLAKEMQLVLSHHSFTNPSKERIQKINEPFAENWSKLLEIIFK